MFNQYMLQEIVGHRSWFQSKWSFLLLVRGSFLSPCVHLWESHETPLVVLEWIEALWATKYDLFKGIILAQWCNLSGHMDCSKSLSWKQQTLDEETTLVRMWSLAKTAWTCFRQKSLEFEIKCLLQHSFSLNDNESNSHIPLIVPSTFDALGSAPLESFIPWGSGDR